MTLLLTAGSVQAQHIIVPTNATWTVTYPSTGTHQLPFGTNYDSLTDLGVPVPVNTSWDGSIIYMHLDFDLSQYDLATVRYEAAVEHIAYFIVNSSDFETNGIGVVQANYADGTAHWVDNSMGGSALLVHGTNQVSVHITGDEGYRSYFDFYMYGMKTNECGVAIMHQPQSMTNGQGFQASFHAGICANTNLSYQWRRNGTNLVNGTNAWGSVIYQATNSELVIDNIQTNDNASYSVFLTNSCGMVSAISSNATLTVLTSYLVNIQCGSSGMVGSAVVGTWVDYWNPMGGYTGDSYPGPEDISSFVEPVDSTASFIPLLLTSSYTTDDAYPSGTYEDPVVAGSFGGTNFAGTFFHDFLFTEGGSDFQLNLNVVPGNYDFYLYSAYPGGNNQVVTMYPGGDTSEHENMDGIYSGSYFEGENYVHFTATFTETANVVFNISIYDSGVLVGKTPMVSAMQIRKNY